MVEIATSTASKEGGSPFLVVATYLPLRSYANVISFVRPSGRIEAQLRASKGAIRYALLTDIPHKRFWTVSVWSGDEAMSLFSRSEPHRTAMKKFYEWGTEEAGIAEWSSNGGTIDWDEAETKLREPAFRFRLEGNRLVQAAGSRSVAGD
ncbi:MAG: hypothetical protein ABSA72_05675 [Nitrososphaerales archaeon]|jgi:quinol monooxygenase YgiN